MENIKIAPSILSANFSKIGEEVKNISECGADFIHLDVMDGAFVRNITFGPKFIKDIRPYSEKVFDAHLMIEKPWKYIEEFVKSGSDYITVHYEACKGRLKDTLKAIKSLGVKCGVAINPNTPVKKIAKVIEECDMILQMSVYPGFGGQKFISDVLPSVVELKKIINACEKDILLEIDGGVTKDNVKIVKDAGVNVVVAGSTVFKETDKKKIIEDLRNL